MLCDCVFSNNSDEMFLDVIPDVFQQIIIAWVMIFAVYNITINWTYHAHIDYIFMKIINTKIFCVSVMYAETILVVTAILNEPAYANSKTAAFLLEQHGDLFWFVSALHQTMVLCIIAFEILGRNQILKWRWYYFIIPCLQWINALFAPNYIMAIAGLLLEVTSSVLILIYGIKLCNRGNKKRSVWGLMGTLTYVISLIPVLFTGLNTDSPHKTVFVMVSFGTMSVFFWLQCAILTTNPQERVTIAVSETDDTKTENAKKRSTEESDVHPSTDKNEHDQKIMFTIDDE